MIKSFTVRMDDGGLATFERQDDGTFYVASWAEGFLLIAKVKPGAQQPIPFKLFPAHRIHSVVFEEAEESLIQTEQSRIVTPKLELRKK